MKEKELNQLKDILIKAKSVSDLYEVLPFLDEQGFSSEMFKERILDNYKEFSPEDFRILYNLSSRYDRFSWFIEGNREILNSTAEDILKEDLFDFSKKIKDIETLNSHKILTQKEQEKFERLKELYKEIYNKLVEEDTKKRQEKIHNSYLVLLKEILDFSKTAKSDEELIEFIQNKRILKSANDLRVLYRALKDCENEFTYDEMQDLLYNVLYTCEKYIDTKRNILKQFLIFDNAEDAVNYIFNYNKYSLFVDSYKNLNPKNFSEKELKKLEEIKLLSEKIISNLKSKERLIEIIEMTKSENYMFSKLVKYMFQIGLKPNLLEESIDEHKQDLSYEQTLILNNISNEYKRFLSYKSYYFKDVLDRKRNNYSDEFIANYLFDNNFSPSMFNRSLRELYPKISKEEYNILFEFLKYYTNIYDKLKERKKL